MSWGQSSVRRFKKGRDVERWERDHFSQLQDIDPSIWSSIHEITSLLLFSPLIQLSQPTSVDCDKKLITSTISTLPTNHVILSLSHHLSHLNQPSHHLIIQLIVDHMISFSHLSHLSPILSQHPSLKSRLNEMVDCETDLEMVDCETNQPPSYVSTLISSDHLPLYYIMVIIISSHISYLIYHLI